MLLTLGLASRADLGPEPISFGLIRCPPCPRGGRGKTTPSLGINYVVHLVFISAEPITAISALEET